MSATEKDLSLTTPEAMECPFAVYARMHEREEGAHHQPEAGGWVVADYADLREMSLDTEHFSNHWHGIGAGMVMMGQSSEPYTPEVEALIAQYPMQMPNALLLADPPISTRHRALVLKALSTKRVRETEPMIQEIVDDLVAGFIDDGRCEFMTQFAGPLPGTISAKILGFSPEEVPKFYEWTELFVAGFIEPIGNDMRVKVAEAVIEYQHRMLELIHERREQPQNDLLSDLVHAEIEEGEELDGVKLEGPKRMSDPELLAILILLVTGGQHTTIGLLGNAMRILCEQPDVLAEVQGDRTLIPDFLEESLRIESPIQCTIRRARADMEAWGTQVPSDARMFAMWGAANQDPTMFPDPRKFDMRRPHNRRHLAFGQGPHFCAGASLARSMTRIAYDTLLSRLDNIRLAPDDGAGGPAVALHPSMSARLQAKLHIEFDRA